MIARWRVSPTAPRPPGRSTDRRGWHIFMCQGAATHPDVRPAYAGYVAWRGLVNERDLSPRTRAELCDWFAFSLLPGRHRCSAIPSPEPTKRWMSGERRSILSGTARPVCRPWISRSLTDIDGVRNNCPIPPTRIRSDVIASMRQDAERLLAPQLPRSFALRLSRSYRPFWISGRARVWRLGHRTVITGDAAFVARPHVRNGSDEGCGRRGCSGRRIASASGRSARGALKNSSRSGFRLGPRSSVVPAISAHAAAGADRHCGRTGNGERHRSPEAVMAEAAVATGIAA